MFICLMFITTKPISTRDISKNIVCAPKKNPFSVI